MVIGVGMSTAPAGTTSEQLAEDRDLREDRIEDRDWDDPEQGVRGRCQRRGLRSDHVTAGG